MTRRALSALSTDTWEMSLDLYILAVLCPPRKPRRPVALSAKKDDASLARLRPTTRRLDGVRQGLVSAKWVKLM